MKTPTLPSRGRKVLLAGVSALSLIVAVQMPVLGLDPFNGAAIAATTTTMSNADIVAQMKPAVVTVLTELSPQADQTGAGPDTMPPDEFFRRFFGENGPFGGMPGMPQMPGGRQAPQQGGHALGSGFIVSADGYVVTNAHVVDNAQKITIKTEDGQELPATLVGTDAKNDIAVLKVDAKDKLPTVQWGNSDSLRVGDPILAIGDPFGVGTTVTSGIVSARGRDLHSGPYDDFIQIDAPINHGNSGGPLVNGEGKVVGINSAIYSPNGGNVGLGFAIPSAQAEKVVGRIIESGSIQHGFIGVTIQPVDDQIAGTIGLKEAKGALIASVQDGSPAAAAELKPGDVIVKVNGTAVETPRNVSRAIADLAPGDKAELTLWRDGAETTATLTVGTLGGEDTAQGTLPGQAGPGAEVPDLGLSVEPLTPDLAARMGVPEDTAGVVVTGVDPKGAAADKGLREGDIIVSVNQTPVDSAKAVTSAVDAAKTQNRDGALLLVQRGDGKSFVAVPFAHS
ncbi:serine protease Do [Defluviimonas denitrificans]|jgi:serine protease Do|uniref:Probable periplasmic serine endoprotease DegP-like n=1 Tax=Albidovulum denitrificans TaxID=404881 RepID=A0A2S8S9I6_9RHOB|nr:DegQ family serine endoprotease [Defluviimonas denitrificans]PQV57462.1 serine protease Do [Defluviimonas denitrificans]